MCLHSRARFAAAKHGGPAARRLDDNPAFIGVPAHLQLLTAACKLCRLIRRDHV